MATVKVSWSGGKDSTCALDMYIKQGDKVKALCYVPMFTDEIPLIFNDHYEFIQKTAERFRSKGAEVNIITGVTYFDWFYKKITRGKKIGQYRGFPMAWKNRCGFMRDGKKKAIESFDCGHFDFQDLGIASDETERQNQIDGTIKRSILMERNMTEEDAFNYCRQHELLSPVYRTRNRDGCALCPNARKSERIRFFTEYPQAIPIVLKMQKDTNFKPLRNQKNFIDIEETLFGTELIFN